MQAAFNTLSLPLESAGLLTGLPRRFLAGENLDLLAPLTFVHSPSHPRPSVAQGSREDRHRMAQALHEYNEALGHPAAAELAERFSDPGAQVVITGQQTGLFGGPLYTLSKAVATFLWAARLAPDGSSAVPLFWCASEDHDYLEVSSASFPTSEGLLHLELGSPPATPCPVGGITLGTGIQALLEELDRSFPSELAQQFIARLKEWCSPKETMARSFGRVLVGLLGERCPLLVDSQLPELKRQQRPFLLKLIERRAAVEDELARSEAAVRQVTSPQVRHVPGGAPLFLIDEDGARRRLMWKGESEYGLRGRPEQLPVAELEALVEAKPERLSPGVLARPALQDAVLGTSLLVLGPGELAYLPQAARLYSLLGLRAPSCTLRPQAVVLDRRQESHLQELLDRGLGLNQLLGPAPDLDVALAKLSGGRPLPQIGPELEALLDRLRDESLAVDPQLKAPWEKTCAQIHRALDRFEEKATQAAARRDAQLVQRVTALRQHFLPDGRLQERRVCSTHFAAKYGDRFVEALVDQLDLDPSRLQFVVVP